MIAKVKKNDQTNEVNGKSDVGGETVTTIRTTIPTFPLCAVIMCWSGEIALSLFSLHLFASHFQVQFRFIYTVCFFLFFSLADAATFTLYFSGLQSSLNFSFSLSIPYGFSHSSTEFFEWTWRSKGNVLDNIRCVMESLSLLIAQQTRTSYIHLPLIWLNRKSLGTY